MVSAHEHRLVLAVAVEQRQRPNGRRDRPLNVGLGFAIRGERLAKVGRFFEKVIVTNHPVEQLGGFAVGPAVGAIVGGARQQLGQAVGQVGVARQQLGQARVERPHDRRFAAAELHALERERAARRELHMHAVADVVAEFVAEPFPAAALTVEFLPDDPVQRAGDLAVRIDREKNVRPPLVAIPQRVAVHAKRARAK